MKFNKGMGMGGMNMQAMMQQAQKLQEQMQKAQKSADFCAFLCISRSQRSFWSRRGRLMRSDSGAAQLRMRRGWWRRQDAWCRPRNLR